MTPTRNNAESGVLALLEKQRDLALGLAGCDQVNHALKLLRKQVEAISVVTGCRIVHLDEECDLMDSGPAESLWNQRLEALMASELMMAAQRESSFVCLSREELSEILSGEGNEEEEVRCWRFLLMAPLRLGGRVMAWMMIFSVRHSTGYPGLELAIEALIAQTMGAISRMMGPTANPRAGSPSSGDALAGSTKANSRMGGYWGYESFEFDASCVGTWHWDVSAQEGVWDERNRRLFGIREGVPITEELFCSRLHPDDRQRVMERISELKGCSQQMVWSNEFRMIHPEMGERWIVGIGRVERNGQGEPVRISGINMDITDRKRIELSMREWNQALERRVAERTAELIQSEARFRLLAEATFEGISVCENGILLDCNPQLARMVGYDLEEMIGMPVIDLIAPESRELVEHNINCGQDVNYEFMGLRRDGSTVPMEAHACRRMWKGKETRVSAIRDLTESKRVAARFLAQQTELYQAQRLALVSEVSAGIVHQIGQPLSAIGANLAAYFASGSADGSPDCGCHGIMRDIDSDIARLRNAVIHLRSLANPEEPKRNFFSLNEVISDVFGLMAGEAKRLGVQIILKLDTSIPLIMMNSIQIGQVVLNLLKNSLDAVAHVEPARKVIVVSTAVHCRGWLEMVVCDKGSGVAPETFPHLFSPFFSTKQEGVGIGLRLSRTIANAHGGSIEAIANLDGVGLTVRLLLPENT